MKTILVKNEEDIGQKENEVMNDIEPKPIQTNEPRKHTEYTNRKNEHIK